jgi:hypothetical protein
VPRRHRQQVRQRPAWQRSDRPVPRRP